MPQYKNVGRSLWRRPTGELVPPGGIFTATVREEQRIQRRKYYGRLEKVAKLSKPAVDKASEDTQKDSTPPKATPDIVETQAAWILKMSPERYLKLHPSGSHAPLAREIAALVGGASA